MPDETPAAPAQALKFTGDVKAGKFVPGIPAQDLTAEQVATWLTPEQYEAALASGHYSAAGRKAADKDTK